MAAMNGGIYGISYWTFCDEPDDPRTGIGHRWGLFRWMTEGATTRKPYYAYGLLTKFFHGPAAVHHVQSDDPLVRVTAVRNETTGTWSIAIINRNRQSTPVSIALVKDPGKPFRKYIYEPAHVPVTEDGDLQEPAGKVAANGLSLADTLPPESLVVYTTAYEERTPPPVRNLQVSPVKGRDWKQIHWQSGAEPGLCYYRVYHNRTRIGSTIGNEFVDAGPTRNEPGDYTVTAVDRSGNAGQPQHVAGGRP